MRTALRSVGQPWRSVVVLDGPDRARRLEERRVLFEGGRAHRDMLPVIRSSVEVGVGPLAEEVESPADRTIAESAWNVRRHAQATSLRLWASRTSDTLIGTVTDNGRGFNVAEALDRARRPFHLGLDATIERLRPAHGSLDIQSTPSAGTTATFTIPLTLT